MSTNEPPIKFSNEESKAQIRAKLSQNFLNLVDLTKSTLASSESSDLFRNCFKNFISNEKIIESTCEKVKKIEIISKQLNFQVDAIKKDCDLLPEICDQINYIQNKTK